MDSNLAEYADASKAARRYVLRRSKTNATLKVRLPLSVGCRDRTDGKISIQFAFWLKHIRGEKHEELPLFRKGEIFPSVSGI